MVSDGGGAGAPVTLASLPDGVLLGPPEPVGVARLSVGVASGEVDSLGDGDAEDAVAEGPSTTGPCRPPPEGGRP
ncbi:hypothetical protein [Streptomyces scabiei]|uniref:hypothetical protein n=1 Tax=Streptomyces scabiei TaxID=1930 RepID=UPI001FF63D7D|nr:hypothetical protein [Streptomyces sp. LBUM 1488]